MGRRSVFTGPDKRVLAITRTRRAGPSEKTDPTSGSLRSPNTPGHVALTTIDEPGVQHIQIQVGAIHELPLPRFNRFGRGAMCCRNTAFLLEAYAQILRSPPGTTSPGQHPGRRVQAIQATAARPPATASWRAFLKAQPGPGHLPKKVILRLFAARGRTSSGGPRLALRSPKLT